MFVSADTYLPDPRVPLTARGWQQVRLCCKLTQEGASRACIASASRLAASTACRATLRAPSAAACAARQLQHSLLPAQAMGAGDRLRTYMDAASGGKPYKLYFYTSPYLRSRQVGGMRPAFAGAAWSR